MQKKCSTLSLITAVFLIISCITAITPFKVFAKSTTRQLPIILIHAFPTDHRLWEPQQEAFHSIIPIDLIGFGHSRKTNGQAVTMDTYAKDLKDNLDKMHIKKIILGGESMGGYVALSFLKHYPEYVEMLILSDTQSIADSTETKQKREATAADVLAHGSKKLIDDFMSKALSATASEQTRQYLRHIVEEQSPESIASALRGMALREDTSDVLSQTSIPVLIITGEKDSVISSQQSINMHKLAKNSSLVIIKNAGHLSNLEQPAEWNEAVTLAFQNQ